MNDLVLSREESQRQTRERLLATALQVVACRGYDGSSIGTIVEAAGFTKGAFFSNFESKDAMLLEIMQRHYDAELVDLTALMDGAGCEDDPSGAMDRYVDQLVRNLQWGALSVELSLRAGRDAAFAAKYGPVRQRFAAALGALIGRMFMVAGRALPLPPEQIGSMLLAFVQGLSLAAASGATEPSGSRAVNLFIDGLIAGAEPIEAS